MAQSTADETNGAAQLRELRQVELDGLSLDQALLDFEVANARVVDLTQRLIEMTSRLREVELDADRHRLALADLEAEHNAMRGSAAFRIASVIWNVRNALRV